MRDPDISAWTFTLRHMPGHFPTLLHDVGQSPYHHHHAPIDIKRYAISVYKIDRGYGQDYGLKSVSKTLPASLIGWGQDPRRRTVRVRVRTPRRGSVRVRNAG